MSLPRPVNTTDKLILALYDKMADIEGILVKALVSQEAETVLPPDCPGYSYLIDAGIDTVEKAKVLTGDMLETISGIGSVTATKILTFLENL